MKKTLLVLLVALIVVSCNDTSKDINMKVVNLRVNNTDWIENLDTNGLNRYYSAHFSMPEINSLVFNTGSVNSYILINNVQQALPYVQHYQNTAGKFWTRTIDFDYSVGSMNVYVTDSDFAVDPPNAMDFRVVVVW